MAPVEHLTARFRASGMKVTPQRERIFRAISGNEAHPTAESIYADVVVDMPTISLRTVYQTLNELADLGEVVRLDLGTGSARFDPNTQAHHHLVCTECGRVTDVYVDTHSLRSPDMTSGFRVDTTEVIFRGTCRSCTESPGDHAIHHTTSTN